MKNLGMVLFFAMLVGGAKALLKTAGLGLVLVLVASLAGCDEGTKQFGNCPSGEGCSDTESMPDILGDTNEQMPFSYSATNISVSVSVTTIPFFYTAEDLTSLAQECGSQHDVGYLDQLVARFNNTVITVYTFKYLGVSQHDDSYEISLMPNMPEYTSLYQFKKDFDVCAVGGSYPWMLSEKWLLFTGSCGGRSDGSGRAQGCHEIQEVIDPSLAWTVETIHTT